MQRLNVRVPVLAFVVLGAGSLFGAPGDSADLPLILDQERDGVLEVDAAGKGVAAFTFEARADLRATIEVTTLEFDAMLRVLGKDGAVLASDNDSGVGCDPRALVECGGGDVLQIEVASRAGGGGAFRVAVRARAEGDPAAPTDDEELKWFEHAGQRALASRKFDFAFGLLAGAGQTRFVRGELDPARDDLVLLLTNARAAQDKYYEVVALAFLGATERRAGDLAAAIPHLEEADREHAAGPTGGNFEEFVLDNLGEAQLAFGRAADALSTFERMGVLTEEKDAGASALCWSSRARALDALGRPADARAAHERSIETIATAEGDAKPYYERQVRGRFATFLDESGDSTRALDQLEQALAIPLTHDDWDVQIDLLGTLCSTLLSLGRLSDARARFAELEAAAAAQVLPAQAPKIELTAAVLALRLGDPYAAARRARAAIDRLTRREQTDLRIRALLILAAASLATDEREEAARALGEADQLVDASRGDGARQRWRIRLDQGNLALRNNDPKSAADLASGARTLAESVGDAFGVACADASLAWQSFVAGRLDEAEDLGGKARAEFQRLSEPERELDALHTLASVALRRADHDAADGFISAASALLDRPEVRSLGTREAALSRAGAIRFGELAMDCAIARADAAEPGAGRLDAAFARASDWKGRALIEGLETATGEVVAPADRAAAARCLSDTAALVEFVEGANDLYALVLCRGKLSLARLGEKVAIAKDTDAYVAVLREQTAPAAVIALGAAAGARFAPVFRVLDPGTVDLVVVPTPDLAQFPFDALVLESPSPDSAAPFAESTFVVDKYRVATLPTTRMLTELESRAPRTGTGRVLLAGDPICALERNGPRDLIRGRDADPLLLLPRLDGSRRELLAIARGFLLSDDDPKDRLAFAELESLNLERSGSRSTRTFDIHLGAACASEVLAGDLTRFSILHFATHGLVDPFEPRRTGLVLSRNGTNPGILTLDDVARLHLDADLIVLSACETARGRVVRGEGVESLAWAFLRAGSRAVIATYWKVDDDDTAVLMTHLYDAMLRGRMEPFAALTEAKRRIRASGGRGAPITGGPSIPLDSRGDPRKWGAFVCIDAPAPRPR